MKNSPPLFMYLVFSLLIPVHANASLFSCTSDTTLFTLLLHFFMSNTELNAETARLTSDWWLLHINLIFLLHYTGMMQWWCNSKASIRKGSTHSCYISLSWHEGGQHFSFPLPKQKQLQLVSWCWRPRPSQPCVMSTYTGVCVSQLHTHARGRECAAPFTHSVKHFCICSFLDYSLL